MKKFVKFEFSIYGFYVEQTIPRTSRSLFGGRQMNHCVTSGNSTVSRATLTTLSLVSVVSVVLAVCPSHLPAARIVINVPLSFELGTRSAALVKFNFTKVQFYK